MDKQRRVNRTAIRRLLDFGFDREKIAELATSAPLALEAINFGFNEVPLKMLREQNALFGARVALACALAGQLAYTPDSEPFDNREWR